MYDNVVLIGFMGTGKTSVGRILARRLGWTFVDTDEHVERTSGLTISQIFAEQGEESFRRLETQALKELLAHRDRVVSTGGGAVLKEENRSIMMRSGLVAALQAKESVIVERVRKDANRPLLQGEVEERVRTLMAARRPLYEFAPLQIHTDFLTEEQVALEIESRLKGEA